MLYTSPYKYACCQHCRHDGRQTGHTRPCGFPVCGGYWPTLAWLRWKLRHPRRRW